MDKESLTLADRNKRREIEKLGAERENLRIREQQLMDDIRNMEDNMMQKEKHFRKEAQEARWQTSDDVFTVNEIKKREMELAKERGDNVVKLKQKRAELEYERERIMGDLDTLKNGGMTNQDPNSGRNNLWSAGQSVMASYDRPPLDPALKDKLIADQVKINQL